MSERRVTWNALANFAQVRREAARTSRSLEELEERQDKLGTTSENTADKIVKSSQKTKKARQDDVRAISEQVDASEDLTHAQQREARSTERQPGILSRLISARKGATQASREQERASQAVTSAQEYERQSALRLQSTNTALEQAKLRLARAEQQAAAAKHVLVRAEKDLAKATGDTAKEQARLEQAQNRASARANDAAQAMLRVEQANLRTARASRDNDQALTRLEAALDRVSTSANRAGGSMTSLSNQFAKARREAQGMRDSLDLHMKFTAIGTAIAHLIPMLAQLSGGLVAVVGALGPVFNSLAALPGMAMGAAISLGAVVAGFSGIGGALKAYETQKTAVAKKSQKADQDTGRAARDAARAVKNAYEAQAEAAENAARRVENASRRLSQAQRDEKAAIDDLNNSRLKAIQYLDDVADRLRDASLSEESAEIALEEALIRLEKTKFNRTSSDLDIRKADLAVREAEARLDTARKNKKEAAKENADAQKKGVEGSDIMTDAHKRVAEASERTADAERDLADAHKDAAKSAKQAAQNVTDALERQADVAKKSSVQIAEAASAGPDKFAGAMAALTPAGRSFVRFMLDEMKPALKQMKDSAQEGLLPGVEAGLRNIVSNLFPLVSKAIEDTAKILGGGFEKFAKVTTSSESLSILERLFEANKVGAQNLTDAAGPLWMALLRIMDAAEPLVTWITELTLAYAKYLDEATKVNTANGDLATAMENTKESMTVLGGILRKLGRIFYNVFRAGRDTGLDILDIFDQWLGKWERITESTEGQDNLKAWFKGIKPGFLALSTIIGEIGNLFKDLAVNPETTSMLEMLAGPGMQALKDLLDELTAAGVGTVLTTALIDITNAITDMLEAGGGNALKAFAESTALLFGALADLMKLPGVAQTLTAIGIAAGAWRAVKVVGMVTGVTSLAKTVRSGTPIVQAGYGKAKGAMGGGYQGKHAAGVGAQTGQGVVAGLKGAKGTVTAAATQMGAQIIAALKKVLKIKSPSQIMFQIGTDIMRGLVNGINSMKGAVSGAITGAAGAGVAGAKGAAKKTGAVAAGAGGAAVMGVGVKGAAAKKTAAAAGGTKAAPAPKAGMGMGMGAGGAAMGVGLLLSLIPAEGALGNILTTVGLLLTVLPMLGGVLTFLLSPIGLVVGAIALIVGGLVLLYKKNETFRNFVDKAWKGIKDAISGAWKNYIKPALAAMGKFFTEKVVPALEVFWEAVKEVFGWVGNLVKWVWKNVLSPIFKAYVAYIKDFVIPIVKLLWEGIKFAFESAYKLIQKAWKEYISPTFRAIRDFIKDHLVPIFTFLWDKVKAVWDNIKNKISAIWKDHIRPIFVAIKDYIKDVLQDRFSKLYTTVSTVFGNIRTKISDIWTKNIKPVLEAFGGFISKHVAPAFSKGVGAIKTAWEKVKEILKKPINWVIKNVINKGIIGSFNKIMKAVGGKELTNVPELADGGSGGGGGGKGPQYFASGGRVRGQSLHPRQDNIDAKLTAGEWVHPVSSARYYGSRIMEAIRRRKIPREALAFAEGGEAPENSIDTSAQGGPVDFLKEKWDGAKKKFNSALDFFADPAGGVLSWLTSPVKNLLNNLPFGAFNNILKPIGSELLSRVGKAAKARILGEKDAGGFALPAGNYKIDPSKFPMGGWQGLNAFIGTQHDLSATVTSGYRSRKLTASGFQSMHNLGRAIDIVGPSLSAIWHRIRNTFGVSNITELIYSPMKGKNIYRGREYHPSAVTMRGHYDHVHWAMNQGGQVGRGPAPKLGMPRYASGGPVLSPSTGFSGNSFRSTRALSRSTAGAGRGGSLALAHRDGDTYSTNVITNVYNPLPERPSESVQRRLSRTAQLGLIGGRRSDV